MPQLSLLHVAQAKRLLVDCSVDYLFAGLTLRMGDQGLEYSKGEDMWQTIWLILKPSDRYKTSKGRVGFEHFTSAAVHPQASLALAALSGAELHVTTNRPTLSGYMPSTHLSQGDAHLAQYLDAGTSEEDAVAVMKAACGHCSGAELLLCMRRPHQASFTESQMLTMCMSDRKYGQSVTLQCGTCGEDTPPSQALAAHALEQSPRAYPIGGAHLMHASGS